MNYDDCDVAIVCHCVMFQDGKRTDFALVTTGSRAEPRPGSRDLRESRESRDSRDLRKGQEC